MTMPTARPRASRWRWPCWPTTPTRTGTRSRSPPWSRCRPTGRSLRAPTGTGTYTPNAGYVGPDSFTYAVSDGHGGTDTAIVRITVNGAPVATDDTATT